MTDSFAEWSLDLLQVESAMGPALQAAFLAMQDFGGKMLLFQSAVPSLGMALQPPPCHDDTWAQTCTTQMHACAILSSTHNLYISLKRQCLYLPASQPSIFSCVNTPTAHYRLHDSQGQGWQVQAWAR